MKKHARGAESPSVPGPALDPRYIAWFERFNAGDYFEAHEVLEALWLRTPGDDHAFFKGLIQIAGAFVHLRKHFEQPGAVARLRPAARLFHTGGSYLTRYGPTHMRLDVAAVCALCESLAQGIEASGFTANPWHPGTPPRIELAA